MTKQTNSRPALSPNVSGIFTIDVITHNLNESAIGSKRAELRITQAKLRRRLIFRQNQP